MIADATFGPARRGVRALRFVPRPALALESARAAAAGIATTLRELLGPCEVAMGEPAAIGPAAWEVLARDALLFVTRGRRTDVVLVLPVAHARRLVRHAFGESAADDAGALTAAACSALEQLAVERIAARWSAALVPLGGGPAVGDGTGTVPPCVAYVDVRVSSPIRLTLGIGIVRPLPEAPPEATVTPAALAEIPLELGVVFADGIVSAQRLAELRIGDVVKFETKVGAPASLNVGERRLATGDAGAVMSRAAFFVHAVAAGAPLQC